MQNDQNYKGSGLSRSALVYELTLRGFTNSEACRAVASLSPDEAKALAKEIEGC